MAALTDPSTHEIAALAARHALSVDPDSIRLNEAGLDYRVAYATADDGVSWVLRIPRRDDMAASIAGEAAVLRAVAAHLDVAVPQWQVVEADLIAYPTLPGTPALTLQDGQPVFHVGTDSATYATDLGRLVAQLHAIPAETMVAAGLERRTPEQVREQRQAALDQVTAAFDVADHLVQRWHRWISTDSYWPTWSVVTHGEIYQAHVLVDADEHITGVLDWTTAAIGDPAVDLAFQQSSAPAGVFEITARSYTEAGGCTWPRLAEHCTEIMAFSPVDYARFALTTGDPEHTAIAQAQLT